MEEQELILKPVEFIAVLNQTLEYAYPNVVIEGELANLRVSKNKWVYFDLKDEQASVKFFGTVYQLPGPLEDGLMVQVRGIPRLHPQYGFSVNVINIQPVGEGSIKKATALLEAKLEKEGLFDKSRKRPLPYPPQKIGLVTSGESAAYHDFIKILNARWGGVEIYLADVGVQGESAPRQIIAALDYFNTYEDVDCLVVTRGGGSPEDLAAFSTEQVTRAVAASRIPTLIAIGHEVDVSLAELAADRRASTPSNASELLVPDKQHKIDQLSNYKQTLLDLLSQKHEARKKKYDQNIENLHVFSRSTLDDAKNTLSQSNKLLEALSPKMSLKRGYAIIRHKGNKVVKSAKSLKPGDAISLELHDGERAATID